VEIFDKDKLKNYSCPNTLCDHHGVAGADNISVRGYYGKDPNKKALLYCRFCGQRFVATQGTAMFGSHLPPETLKQIIHHAAEGVGVRATARLLGIDKTTVNNVILRVGRHCAEVLSSMLRSLDLTEVQLDELWRFVKKKNVMGLLKRTGKKKKLNPVKKV
jgi:transposase-like protein